MARRKNNLQLEKYFSPMGWYPQASKSDYYVFLSTLDKDNPGLYQAAESLLKVNGNSADFSAESHFLNALVFLKMAAESERSKEINFLRSKGIEVSSNINYIDLIKEISEAIIGVEELERRIKEEITRRGKRGTGSHSYTQALGGYIGAALNQLKNKGRTRNTLAAIVRTELIKATKTLSGNLNLDEIAAVIGVTQTQIMQVLQEEIDKDVDKELYYNKNGKLSVTKVGELIRKTPLYQERFGKNAHQDLNEFKMIANNILSKYGQVLSSDAKKRLRTNTADFIIPDSKMDWNKLGFSPKTLSKLTELEADELYTYSFRKNTGMGGEARIYQDLQGMITQWLGGSGGKADIFSYTLGEVELTEQVQNQQFESAIQRIIDNISAKTQSEFDKVNKNISQSYEEIENILQDISQELNELKQAFIIHSNVKDYFSTATSDFSGFEGGTYSGLSVIDAIHALGSAGFPLADIDWLKTCLVNTSEASIGTSNKTNLEKYLSIFATMLLFDDGVTIAQDVAKNFQTTSLNVLHLFPVNGIYVPSSYVMSTIASSLEAWLSNNSGGENTVSVNINPGKINFSESLAALSQLEVWGSKRWNSIREQQIGAMSVRIKFLANFRAIMNRLTSS